METTFLDYVKAFGPVIVGLAGVYFGYLTSISSAKARLNDQKRDELNKTIDSFYNPLIHLLSTSKKLYEVFETEHRKKDQTFSTLLSLLNGEKFEGNDRILLELIIDRTNQANNLIKNSSEFIDDSQLQSLLSDASAHWDILKKAYNKELVGEPERFLDYTYPIKLQSRLEEKVIELKNKISELDS